MCRVKPFRSRHNGELERRAYKSVLLKAVRHDWIFPIF